MTAIATRPTTRRKSTPATRQSKHRRRMINLARNLLSDSRLTIVYTEMTGIGPHDEIVQIAIIDAAGETLLHTLIRPTMAVMHAEAQAVNGIDSAMLRVAPSILKVNLGPLLIRTVAGYNVGFDKRLIAQTLRAAGDPRLAARINDLGWHDVMQPYALYYGGEGGRWQKLSAACEQQGVAVDGTHDALADARLTLGLLRTLAEGD